MNIGILLAGGCGSRMKCDMPKQLIKIKNKPLMCYALAAFLDCKMIDQVQIVISDECIEKVADDIISMGNTEKIMGFSRAGATRQESILNALNDMVYRISEEDVVVIHDGARPLASQQLFEKLITSLEGCDGVIPVLPVKDTIYRCADGIWIDEALDRSHLVAGQSPEAFVYGKYLKINRLLAKQNRICDICGSTEAAILAGMKIKMIEGEETNFKITTQEDLKRFESIIAK